MIILRFLGYILACQFYVFRLAFYLIHSVLVFFTKPGARLVIPLAVIALIFWARGPIETVAGTTIDAIWNGAMRVFVPSDLYAVLSPYRVEIAALFGLVVLFIAISILSSMLRPIVGTFSAPRRPIPPVPPLIVPNTKVRTVRARIAVPKRGRSRFRGELEQLMQRLPDHLAQLPRQKPLEGRTSPPASFSAFASRNGGITPEELPGAINGTHITNSQHRPSHIQPMHEPSDPTPPQAKRPKRQSSTERDEQDRVARAASQPTAAKPKRRAKPKQDTDARQKPSAVKPTPADRARAERVAALRRRETSPER